jgi:chemotaxis response regulator CheB
MCRQRSAAILGERGLDFVGTASATAQTLRLVAELEPDVILIDSGRLHREGRGVGPIRLGRS